MQVRELNLEGWRRTRLQVFAGAAPYMKNKNATMYDFFPLPGDPTPAELEAARQEEAKRMEREMQAALDDLMKRGYLTQNITVQA